MSLYKRNDSSVWWIKLHHSGKIVQRSTGTADKVKAREYHDRLKASLWEQERLGTRPRYSWQQVAGRWIEETSDKATHKEDVQKLKWLHPYLGELMLDEITLDTISLIKSEKHKQASKATTNRYLAVIRSILIRARDEWEWVEKVPKIKLFKEPEGRECSITPAEANRLLAELPPHLRDMALFTLHTGLRQSNVLQLEWSCMDLARCHTWATWLRQLRTPTHELQRMGGWKTAAMVERYAHVAPDHLAQAAARLESVGVGYNLATVNQTGGGKHDA
jgi:integrase